MGFDTWRFLFKLKIIIDDLDNIYYVSKVTKHCILESLAKKLCLCNQSKTIAVR